MLSLFEQGAPGVCVLPIYRVFIPLLQAGFVRVGNWSFACGRIFSPGVIFKRVCPSVFGLHSWLLYSGVALGGWPLCFTGLMLACDFPPAGQFTLSDCFEVCQILGL